MKILTSTQISQWDSHTIDTEPIASIDLMERAAQRLSEALQKSMPCFTSSLTFFVGKGNNGGDGLAMARILSGKGYRCRVVLLSPDRLNENCLTNLNRLPKAIEVLEYPYIPDRDDVVVDAILGSGLRGEVDTFTLEVIKHINKLPNFTVSIDLPSGMYTEWGNCLDQIVHADLTLTIQAPKLAFVTSEAGEACGQLCVVNIGLDRQFAESADTPYSFIDECFIENNRVAPRAKFSHKGNYGKTLLICGSKGMAGAAILASGGALRSGCGYVCTAMPQQYISALLARYPSALTIENDFFCQLPPNLDQYSSIAVGCGMGQHPLTVDTFGRLLQVYQRPMVLDADAINILARTPDLIPLIPQNSVLTPHVGELQRLIGSWQHSEELIDKATNFARKYNLVLMVKGAYTMICLPNGEIWFNSTGNAFMAKAGAGDVLTGLIAGLIARGYDPHIATAMGVFHHGLAGQRATEVISGESFCANDLIDFILL